MTDINSDIYERLIGSRATTLANVTPGDSLQGIITTELMDGALCYVKDIKAIYQFDRSSAAPAAGITVVVPNGVSPVGRWVLLSSSGDVSYLSADVELATSGVGSSTGALTINQWAALPAGDSFYTDTVLSDLFSVSFSSGIMTYLGPSRRYLAQLMVSLQCATALQNLEVGISRGGDFIGGTTNSFDASRCFTNPTTGTEDMFVAAQRIVSLSQAFPTVQGMVRNLSSGGAILLTRYHMVLSPLS